VLGDGGADDVEPPPQLLTRNMLATRRSSKEKFAARDILIGPPIYPGSCNQRVIDS
jgi:hypothetical protein